MSASAAPLAIVTREDAVATLTLNRPEKRNALSKGLLGALADALSELASDGRTRAVVLTGAGPGFCAGVDLEELAAGGEFGPDDLRALNRFGLPIIAAVNGPAFTGGLEVALACDFRIASERAVFADTHALVGGVPGWGLTARLPQAVGQSWARQMSFTGMRVDAATALRIGLVNEVVDHDRLLPRAQELAQSVARTAAPSLARIRACYDAGRDGTAADALAGESLEHGQVVVSHEELVRRKQSILSGRSATL